MKFRWKLTFSMVCVVSLLFSLEGILLMHRSFQQALEQEQTALEQSYNAMLNTLQLAENMGRLGDEKQLSAVLQQNTFGSEEKALSITLLREQTELFHTGVSAVDHYANSLTEKKLCHFQDETNRRYLQLSGCFSVDEMRYTLTIARDITAVYESRKQQEYAYYLIYAGLMVTCFVVSYLISKGLTRPLTQLSKATQAISKGNLSSRANLHTQDEIGAVGADFDQMAASMEETVNQLKETMQQQERFVGNFTHELKTPMTAIIGYADLIRRQNLDAAEQRDAAQYIFSEAQRLERLSMKLLDLQVGKHTQIQLEPASPADILAELQAHFAPVLAQSHIYFTAICEPGLCNMEQDLVKSLCINLIDNARKAMPKGGSIMVTGHMTSSGCKISVQDTGQGIPPEALAHLTEAFYRVDKARSRALGGAGLGLSLCKTIAELHNGTISFASETGKGTCVTVTLNGGRA